MTEQLKDKMDPQVKIIAQVITERKHQDMQWGGPAHDDQHPIEHWMGYLLHQLDRIRHQHKDRDALIKIAALAVAAVESLDRKIK
jgi:hypothetical protein